MLIHYMHSYCGGRLLTGLFNPSPNALANPGFVWNLCGAKWTQATDGRNTIQDPCHTLPGTELEFLQILKKMLYVEHGQNGYQAVVFAVTNSEQTVAPKYLEAAGFKKIGKFAKGVRHRDCTSWVGDYRKDMYPILSKVPNYSEAKKEQKFAIPTQQPAQQIAAAAPIPMPQPVRNSTEQTQRIADALQGTNRTRSRK